MQIQSVLLLNDDRRALEALKGKLNASAYAVETAADLSEARRVLAARPVDIVICDNLSLHEQGVDFLEWITDSRPSTVVVIISAWADYSEAVEGVKRAAMMKARFDAPQERNDNLEDLRRRMAEELERNYPGITEVRRDPKGFLILDRRF